MRNATIPGRPSVLFRLALCVLLVWGLAPLSALADTPSSEALVEGEEVSAQGGPEVPEGAAADPDGEGLGDPPYEESTGETSFEPLDVRDASDASAEVEADTAEAIDFAAVSDYTGLVNAVASASPGATIEVSGAIVFADVIPIDKPLSVVSADGAHLTAAAGKRHFSIDGASIVGGQGVVFEGLTLYGPVSAAPDAENGGIFATNMSSATLSLTDCTFSGNENTEAGARGYGGALAVASNSQGVTLVDCAFADNAARVDGGAVSTKNSPATYERCVFRNNTSGSHGGALASASNASLIDCLFEGNEATGNGGGASFIFNNIDPVTVRGTTFARNVAANSGGGLHVLNFVFDGIPNCVVENSTFFGNEVTNPNSVGRTYIGAAALIDAQATLQNITVIGNSAPDSATGTGAGIVLFEEGFDGSYTHVVEGCLAVGNYQDGAEGNMGIMSGSPFGGQTYSPYADAVASLTEIPAASTLGDIVVVDSLGAPLLASNGGLTQTVALVASGPAVDAYGADDVTLAPLATDQRGKGRPAGGGHDIGSFELQDDERDRDMTIVRLFGADRYGTSHKVSTHDRSGSDVVVLTSGEDRNFPDALAASALSGIEDNAPIVLTKTQSLSPEAREAIGSELQPSRVIIIGDQHAVSAAVESEVRSLLGEGGTVDRIGGVDRQDTADKIYEAYAPELSSTAILALATDFPDALSVSSWAAKTKSPIFLVHFGSTGLTDASLEALRTGGFDRILVMGSTYSVSNEVVLQALSASGLGYGDYTRFNGIDRYDTSAQFAAWAISGDRSSSERLTVHGAAIVRGDKHPDSLTGGALQGRDSSVVVLTPRDEVSSAVVGLLDGHVDEIGELRFFGDEYAVDLDVVRHYIQRVPYTSITWMPDSSVAIL